MIAKMDDELARLASSRQARFLGRIRIQYRYPSRGRWFGKGGLYTLLVLWNAAKKLDQNLIVGEHYRSTLEGELEFEAWDDAGSLLLLMVRSVRTSL